MGSTMTPTSLEQIRKAIGKSQERQSKTIPYSHGDKICCLPEAKWRDALELAVRFINGQTFCAGKRHDCPSCNGDYAEETLDDIARLLSDSKGGG